MDNGVVNQHRDSAIEIRLWHVLLRDEEALLKCPGAHHKALLSQAHALYRDHLISNADLGDLLEQADGALAYAVEVMLDCREDLGN